MASWKASLFVVLVLASTTTIVYSEGAGDDCDYSNETLEWVQNATDAGEIQLFCSAAEVNFNINISALDWIEVEKVDFLVLVNNSKEEFNDSECEAQEGNDGFFSFSITSAFGACAEKISLNEDDGYIYVDYKICVVPNFEDYIITRDAEAYIEFSCVYSRDLLVDIGPLQPIQDAEKYIKTNDDIENFELVLYRFTDDSFEELEDSYTVTDGSPVFLKTYISVNDRWDIIMQAWQCYATPSNDRYDDIRYDIILDGCPADDTLGLADANEVYANFVGTEVEFSFIAFHWSNLELDGQNIFIHCDIAICNQDESDCTNPNVCGSRKRRSTSNSQEKKIEMKEISMGPFTVQQKSTQIKCDKVAMQCHYDCAVSSLGAPTCVCPRGSVLGFDGKTCSHFGPEAEKIMVRNKSDNIVGMLNSALMLVLMASIAVSLVAGYVRRRPQKK